MPARGLPSPGRWPSHSLLADRPLCDMASALPSLARLAGGTAWPNRIAPESFILASSFLATSSWASISSFSLIGRYHEALNVLVDHTWMGTPTRPDDSGA